MENTVQVVTSPNKQKWEAPEVSVIAAENTDGKVPGPNSETSFLGS